MNVGCAIETGAMAMTNEGSVVSPITDGQRITAFVQDPAQLYETLLNAQSDLGVGLLISAGERIVYANAALCAMLAYSDVQLGSLRWPADLAGGQAQAVVWEGIAGGRFETRLLAN